MFPFSKSTMILMLLIFLFGGESRLVEGLEKCLECTGNNAGLQGPACDESHTGKSVDCMTAWAMIRHKNMIMKRCEADGAKWKEPDGTLKCIKDKECYCDDGDDCNRPKEFGRSGRDDYDDTMPNAAVGRKNLFPTGPILSYIVAMVVVVAC